MASKKRRPAPARRRPRVSSPLERNAPNIWEQLGAFAVVAGEAFARTLQEQQARAGTAARRAPAPNENGEQLARDRDLFGLEVGFTSAQLGDAYKRLARAHHPDQGGTDKAMQRVNLARDRLRPLAR